MYSYEEQVKMAVEAEETALYVEKKLKELEAEIQQDLWVLRAPASLSVCFKRPNDTIVRKYCLSGHWLYIDGEWRQYVHICAMVGVTKLKIDEFVDALSVPSAFN